MANGQTVRRSEMVRLGQAVRAGRARAGHSVALLAAMAGIAKSTISEIENGSANPSIETLWRIADALEVSVAQLVQPDPPDVEVVRAGAGVAVGADDADYTATVLFTGSIRSSLDMYRIDAQPGTTHNSAPHPDRTVEHVVIVSGAATLGPDDNTVRLGPGDYVRYRADRPHAFTAHGPTVAVMAIESR